MPHQAVTNTKIIIRKPRMNIDTMVMRIVSVTLAFCNIISCIFRNLAACSSVMVINISGVICSGLASHFGSSFDSAGPLLKSFGAPIRKFRVRAITTHRSRKRSSVPVRNANVSICSST